MIYTEYKSLIKQVKIGKKLPDSVYIHKDSLTCIPKKMELLIIEIAQSVNLNDENWDVIKLFKNQFNISFLSYPDFYTESYPELKQSVNVCIKSKTHKIISYAKSSNPPILHRKENMIAETNSSFKHFQNLTHEGEKAGLYKDTSKIGFKKSWMKLIDQKGYQLINGRIVLKSNKLEKNICIERHKTAIVRHQFSRPIKKLAEHGYLEGKFSIFDYGCGKGDDLRELKAHDIVAHGWDPVFEPKNNLINSDIVNLGFVINVIEDRKERIETLKKAWQLTKKILVVSVMLIQKSIIEQFKPYKDGFLTSRNTFQKYYTQSEIKNFIESSIYDEAIPICKGIFYIFKDKIEEQKYLQKRYQKKLMWNRLTTPTVKSKNNLIKDLILQHQDLVQDFWKVILSLGRLPSVDEYSRTLEVKTVFGSTKKAFKAIEKTYDLKQFHVAAKQRKEDLLLYLALELFSKKKSYKQLSFTLQKDIKYFFGNYRDAQDIAKDLLFSIADPIAIAHACLQAKEELPACLLKPEHSLILDKQYLDDLPLLLRIYVGAALKVYGEIDENIHLVKIHIRSGKLTLCSYDDFNNSIPHLVERIKIKMAVQDIEFFEYKNPLTRPPLLNKHLYINPNLDCYQKQQRFDLRLSKIMQYDHSKEILLTRKQWDMNLHIQNKKITGYKIVNSLHNKVVS